MKKLLSLLIAVVLFFCIPVNQSCNKKVENKDSTKTKDSTVAELPPIKSGSFFNLDSNSANDLVLADTIIYNVVVKNPDPEDSWQKYSLKYFNKQALANIIFNAIYNGRLTPYNYKDEKVMTIAEVKDVEKRHPRSEIANIQFTEVWYFNEKELSFSKKVNSIMMAYERKSSSGEINYTAGVQVYLNNSKKNLNQNNRQ